MTLTPNQAYHKTNPRHVRNGAAVLLEVAGDRELPDANLTEVQRTLLKGLAHDLRVRLSSCELIYLAGAVEVEANGKRSEEESLAS